MHKGKMHTHAIYKMDTKKNNTFSVFVFLFLECEEFSNLLSLHVHTHFNLTQKGVCFLSSNHLKALKIFKENKSNCIIVKKKM